MDKRLERYIDELLKSFPKLISKKVSSSIYELKGEIDIFDSDGNYCDSFLIKIITPNNYPYSYPKLFELSNKFPHNEDRHINKDDSCCVCMIVEELLRSRRGITLKEYMIEYAIPFLSLIVTR